MFCENCGAKIADGDLFCQVCGTKVSVPDANDASISTNQQPEPLNNIPVTNSQAQADASNQANAQTSTQTVVRDNNTSAQPMQNNNQQNPYANTPNPYAAPQNGQQIGYTSTAPTAAVNNGPKSKINKKVIIIASCIAAVVIVGIIILCVCISNANNPVNKMINAINAGEYDEAETIYYANIDQLYGNKDIINAIQQKVDAVKEDYTNGTIDYDEAYDMLDDIGDLPMAYSTNLSEIKSDMYDIEQSNTYFKKAEEYLSKKDYSNAIYYYDQVAKDSKNYKTAQSQKEKAVDGIRKNYLDKAKDYVKDGSYSSAVNQLQYGLENDYLKDDDVLTKQISAYVDEAIKKSENMFSDKGYEAALSLIEDLKSSFSEGDSNYQKLDAQYEKLEKETPVLLHEMAINNYDYFYKYQSGSKDVLGNVYDSGNVCSMSISKYNSDKGAYVEVYAKDYKKVSGTLAVENGSACKARFEIIGDGKTLYKSEELTNKSKPIVFDVNIKDVEWLTIKLTYVKDSGYTDVILSDVEFYKIGSSVADAPENSIPEESSKPESSKPESSKPESSKPESSKPESSKPESSKPESSKPESSKNS